MECLGVSGNQCIYLWASLKQSRYKIDDNLLSSQENLLAKSSTATLGRIIGRGIGYIAQIILARVLAPDGFGLFAIGWIFLRFFSIAGHLGLDSGVIKFGGGYWHKDPQKLRSTALIALTGAFLSGTIFGVGLYIFAPWLAIEFFRKPDLLPIFRGFALTFPFASVLRVAAATNSLSGRMLCGAISEDIAQPVMQTVLFLVFFHSGMGLNSALLSVGISYIFSVVLGLICVARSLPRIFSFEKILLSDLVPLFRFSLPAIVGVTLGAFNLWGDRLLVGYFSTEAITGIYQSISIVTMFTTIILSGIKIAIAPAISNMHHNNNHEGVKTLTKSIIRWVLYISLPVIMFLTLNANSVIISLFGVGYERGTVPLIILTIGQVFYITFGIADQIFLMTGKQKEWFRISIVTFVLTIFLDAILIPRFDLLGASIVSSAMMIFMGILSMIRLKHHLNFWLIDGYHGKIIIASLVTVLVTFIFTTILNLGFMTSLIISFIIASIVFFMLLISMGLEPNDKAITSRVIKKRLT